ncbi:hypothetical protein [Candidatus Poriferisodalis sp.]|uniref:hypothetical protein n=1 Tax=Candidatus Poriferisodalis sp. TaxID=3101277 RepID=UPI003B02884F
MSQDTRKTWVVAKVAPPPRFKGIPHQQFLPVEVWLSNDPLLTDDEVRIADGPGATSGWLEKLDLRVDLSSGPVAELADGRVVLGTIPAE